MNVSAAIELLLQLLASAGKLGEVISKARAENRDITDAELLTAVGDNDAARTALAAALDKAKSEGR